MDDRISQRVGDLLADAGEAAARGDRGGARALARAVLSLRPDEPQALALVRDLDHASGIEGERRQLTVMFCDVVGSTALSQAHDPEVVADVVRRYRHALDLVVTRAEGHIGVWIGDGALVYFGYPTAHEDDAWRAVRTGLALLEEVRRVAEEARSRHGVELGIRVAVHTGLVVRAEMGTATAPDRDAIVGATPNLAARLQDKARPGTLVISEATHALVRGRFAVVPIGPFRLKGFTELESAYEVRGEAGGESSLESFAPRGGLVGRTAELAVLTDAWDEVSGGAGRGVLVVGDPGVGKTRLAAELRVHVLAEGGRAIQADCSTFHQATPLHPARRIVELAAGIERDTPPAAAVARIEASLARHGLEEGTGLVATLLGLPTEGELAPELDAPRLRVETLELLVRWLRADAATGPLLLVLDDVQWIDPSTAELVGRILRTRVPQLLVVLLARPGGPDRWSAASLTTLELTALDEQAARTLVAELAGPGLARSVVDDIVNRADGVPLFVEELVEVAQQVGPGVEGLGRALPGSLREPLLARLVAAGGDLGLAQTVATVGAAVPMAVLAEVTGVDGEALRDQVGRLLDADILATEADGAVRFRHHLLGDVAYETQLHEARRQRHGAIADALAAEGALPAVLADHLEAAGDAIGAIEQLLAAGQDAQAQNAHDEAGTHIRRGLALLPSVADEEERLSLELRLRETASFTAISSLGWGADQAFEDLQRVAELLRSLPHRPSHEVAFVTAFGFFLVTGRLEEAAELNRQGRAHLTAQGAVDLLMPVEAGDALIDFFAGDFGACIRDADAFLASPAGAFDVPMPPAYPLPNELVCTVACMSAVALAFAGRVDEAEARLAAAHERAAALPFPHGPFSTAWIHSHAAVIWLNLEIEPAFRRAVEGVRTVAVRHGMDNLLPLTAMQDAMAAVRFGEITEHQTMSGMLTMWHLTGVRSWLPCFSSAAVEAQLRLGDATAADRTLSEALAMVEETGARQWESALLRQRSAADRMAERSRGVNDLVRAGKLAADQGSTLFEVLAWTDLVQLDADPGAVALLARAVERFGRRVDLPPVQRAVALLDAVGDGDG